MNRRLIFLAIILASLIAFFPTLFGEFLLLDDELLILDNPKVHGLNLQNLIAVFTTYDPELYIPLTLLTHQIEYAVFGLYPFPYHITNVALHIGNGILVFLIFERWFSRRVAFVLSLLFTLHPIQTEAVAWASARKDVLSAFFFLLASYLYVRRVGVVRERPVWMRAVREPPLLAFLCALLSKVSTITLPFVLLLIDWYEGSLSSWERVRVRVLKKLPYFLISLLFLIIAFFGKRAVTVDLWTPLLLSFASISLTLKNILLPFGLSIFYPFTDAVTLLHPQILTGVVLVALVTGVTFGYRWRSPALLFSWLLFLLLLAPSFVNVAKGGDSGVVDLYITSDRYAYIALLGPLYLIGSIAQVRDRLIWVLFPVIAVLGTLAFRQSHTWQTSEALFRNVAEHHENSHIAYNNLAGVLAKSGRISEAIALYEKSLSIQKNWRSLMNLAQIHAARGEHREAVVRYEELLTLRPDDAYAHSQVGGLYLRYGEVDRAYQHLERARALDSNIASVHYNLGLIYEHIGEKEKAKESFFRVLELDPDDPQARGKLSLF